MLLLTNDDKCDKLLSDINYPEVVMTKNIRTIGSVMCFLVAAASIVFALFAKNARGFLVGLAFFRTVQTGSFMGMIGNIFGILLTAAGFGAAGYYWLSKKNDKKTLIACVIMTGVCLLSMVFAFIQGTFTFGDLIMLLPCGMILYALFKEH